MVELVVVAEEVRVVVVVVVAEVVSVLDETLEKMDDDEVEIEIELLERVDTGVNVELGV